MEPKKQVDAAYTIIKKGNGRQKCLVMIYGIKKEDHNRL
jgi:hypothetical protein